MRLLQHTRDSIDSAITSARDSALAMSTTLAEASTALMWVTIAAVAAVIVSVVALIIAKNASREGSS